MYISRDVVFVENYFPLSHNSQEFVSSSVSKSSQTIFPILIKSKSHALSLSNLFVPVPFDLFVSLVSTNDICFSSQNTPFVPSGVMPISHTSFHP